MTEICLSELDIFTHYQNSQIHPHTHLTQQRKMMIVQIMIQWRNSIAPLFFKVLYFCIKLSKLAIVEARSDRVANFLLIG
jgi:hypothetical protein